MYGTGYILRVKSINQLEVHSGLSPSKSVSYYSMVHTGMYQYELSSYNSSQFQMCREQVMASIPCEFLLIPLFQQSSGEVPQRG